MRTEEIRGIQALNLLLANRQWTIADWKEWCKREGAGLILEDGAVKGYDIEARRFHQ